MMTLCGRRWPGTAWWPPLSTAEDRNIETTQVFQGNTTGGRLPG
jgi:hypothetical protein